MPDETTLTTTHSRDREGEITTIFLPEDSTRERERKANNFVSRIADKVIADHLNAGGLIEELIFDLEERVRDRSLSALTPFGGAIDDTQFVARVRAAVRAAHLAQREAIFDKALALDDGFAIVVEGDESAVNELETIADPVTAYDGRFVHEACDLRLSGAGIDFTFTRTYKSGVLNRGPLGVGWDHDYNGWLRVSADRLRIVQSGGSLREDVYRRHEVHGYWVPPDGQDGVIVEDGDSFRWRSPNGVDHLYRRRTGPDPDRVHVLARIEDRFGNYIAFQHRNGLLVRAEVNHPARFLLLDYDEEGRIVEIRDHGHAEMPQRRWCYHYDDLGDLIQVTGPGTDNYPRGSHTCYEYSSAAFTDDRSHNLLRIIDGNNCVYLESEYGTDSGSLGYNRVIRQRQGGGETLFEYRLVEGPVDGDLSPQHRPARETLVTERSGLVCRHVFNRVGNLLLEDQAVNLNGVCRILRTHFRYNRDGNLVGTLSPEGVMRQFAYGRELFLRSNPGVDENELHRTAALTIPERLAFGRPMVTVSRARSFTLSDLSLAQGFWGDIFPDIFGATQIDEDGNSSDIIVKTTYEPVFGQVLTVSDPRFTNSALTGAANEHPLHEATLMRHEYGGPLRLLRRIVYPRPQLPDGTLGNPVEDRFERYDTRGRIERRVNRVGIATETAYVPDTPGDPRSGHLSRRVRDADGLAETTEYERDTLGRIVLTRFPRSAEAPGESDRFVRRASYDERGQQIERIESAPFNYLTRFVYDAVGRIARVERPILDPDGTPRHGGVEVRTFCHDEESNLVRTSIGGTDSAGHLVNRHCYDASGRRILSIRPRGNRQTTAFDLRSQPVRQTAGAGTAEAASSVTRFDGDGRIIATVDGRGNVTGYTLDTHGRAVEEEDALGHLTRLSYDKAGNVICTRVFERRGEVYFLLSRRQTEFDVLNRATVSIVNRFEEPIGPFARPAVATAHLAAPGPGKPLRTETHHDANGRVIRIADPAGRKTLYTYDAVDRVKTETNPLGNVAERHYDRHGNLVRLERTDRILDDTGQPTGTVRCFAQSAAFDELDRPVLMTDSLGNSTAFAYDSRDNRVRTTDPRGTVTRSDYDLYARRISISVELTDTGDGEGTPVAVATTSMEWDNNGNLGAIIDARGQITRYDYDALDRRHAVIYPDGARLRYAFDPDGNLIARTDPNGSVRIYTVDAIGRTRAVQADTSDVPEPLRGEIGGAMSETYAYDGLDRPISVENDFARCTTEYNSLGWPMAETITPRGTAAATVQSWTLRRRYDDVGAVRGVTYGGGRQLAFDRDEADRLVAIRNLAAGEHYPGDAATPVSYDILRLDYAGRHHRRWTHFNGVSSDFRQDAGGRLIDIAHTGPGGPLLRVQQLFDSAGAMRLRNDSDAGHGQRFNYDSLSRLTAEAPAPAAFFAPEDFAPASNPLGDPIPNQQGSIDASIGAAPQTPGYRYDLVGNRLDRTVPPARLYAVNSLDQYETETDPQGATARAFAYDRNGNLKSDGTRAYDYDSLDRLIAVRDVATGQTLARYVRDAHGRQIMEETPNAPIWLFYDGENVVAEYGPDGLPRAQFVHADGPDQIVQAASSGTERAFHADMIGSIRLLTGRDGSAQHRYRYDAFGQSLGGTGDSGPQNRWRFTGRRIDFALGIYDYRARHYDPALGRFLQRDPAGMADGTNLYSYTANNPLAAVDPSGLGRLEFEEEFDEDMDPFVDGHTCAEAALYGIEYRPSALARGARWAGRFAKGVVVDGGGWWLDRGEEAVDTLAWGVSGSIDFLLTPIDWIEEQTCGHPGCSAYAMPGGFAISGTKEGLRRLSGWIRALRPSQRSSLVSTVRLASEGKNVAAEVESLRRLGKQPMTLLDAKLLAQEEVARLDDLPGFFGRGSRRRAHGPALAVSRGEKSSKVELFLNNQNGDLPYALEREVFDTRFALSEKEWAQIYAKTRGAGTHAEVYGVNFQRLQGEAFKDISLFVFQTPWNNTRTLELWQKYRFLRPFPPCKHCERFVLKTRVWPPVGSTWPLAK